MYAQDSIELLQRSGIKFKEHEARGIDVNDFGELLTSSGASVPALVLSLSLVCVGSLTLLLLLLLLVGWLAQGWC